MTDVITELARAVEQWNGLPSGRRRKPPAPGMDVPVQREALNWEVGAPGDVAAVAALRANLHALAADVHELAAAVHEWRADEHERALLAGGVGSVDHRLLAVLRRTAAGAERSSAQTERARRSSLLRLSRMES